MSEVMGADERRARKRRWYAKNRERLVETQRKKRAANRERTRAYCREWYAKNKESRKEEWAAQRRASYARDIEKHREYHARKLEKARRVALAHYGPDGKAACCGG